MNFPALLAEFAPIDAQFQLNVWNVVVLVTAIAALVTALKRKPPLESELTKLNLTIDNLTSAGAKLEQAQTLFNQALGKIEGQGQTLAAHGKAIEDLKSSLKDLDARREADLQAQRTYTRETSREIYLAIGELKDAFSANVQRIERAIGNLEGTYEGIDRRVERLENREN